MSTIASSFRQVANKLKTTSLSISNHLNVGIGTKRIVSPAVSVNMIHRHYSAPAGNPMNVNGNKKFSSVANKNNSNSDNGHRSTAAKI